ncbi:MAG: hypothetical protein V1792_15515 [Pseudomonadota bacterium]
MSTTRILFVAASLILAASPASEAPAGVSGNRTSYVSGYPSAGETSGTYPQYTGGGYQYRVTYHGPVANQPASRAYPNGYGRYAAAPPAQGYPQYQQVAPQRTAVPNYGGAAGTPAVYPQPLQQHGAMNQPRGAQQIQPGNRTTYVPAGPVRRQNVQPYGYYGQPAVSYYGTGTPRLQAATRSPYYSNPYQYDNQGWYSGSSCPTGSS